MNFILISWSFIYRKCIQSKIISQWNEISLIISCNFSKKIPIKRQNNLRKQRGKKQILKLHFQLHPHNKIHKMEFPPPGHSLPIPKIYKLLFPINDNLIIYSINIAPSTIYSNSTNGIRNMCVTYPWSIRRLPKVQGRLNIKCLASLDIKTRQIRTNIIPNPENRGYYFMPRWWKLSSWSYLVVFIKWWRLFHKNKLIRWWEKS